MSKYTDLKIKYRKWIKERKMSDEITRIVKLLQQRGGLSKDEIGDLDATIKKLRKEVAIPQKTEYKLILNERAATAVWANGFSVAFHMDGSIHCSMDGMPTEHTSITKLSIEFGALESCLKHIAGLNEKQKTIEIYNAVNAVERPKAATEGKTKFVHTSNKKAFVAGMILGRKVP